MGKKDIITGQKINPEKLTRAKKLRREMTPAERHLWQSLRGNRLEGWHFRRQQIIDSSIVDFYCHKAGLVIEIDGLIHQQQKLADNERTKVMTDRGLKVIRFTNREVMNDLNKILKRIIEQLESNPPFLEERG